MQTSFDILWHSHNPHQKLEVKYIIMCSEGNKLLIYGLQNLYGERNDNGTWLEQKENTNTTKIQKWLYFLKYSQKPKFSLELYQ